DHGEGSVFVWLRRAVGRVRKPGDQGHHRPDQGRALRDPGGGLRGRPTDYHRGHGRRSAEEAERGPGHARWRRHGRHGLLRPALNAKWKARENPGPFCSQYSWKRPGTESRAFCLAVGISQIETTTHEKA